MFPSTLVVTFVLRNMSSGLISRCVNLRIGKLRNTPVETLFIILWSGGALEVAVREDGKTACYLCDVIEEFVACVFC